MSLEERIKDRELRRQGTDFVKALPYILVGFIVAAIATVLEFVFVML